jgi:hypothetical protein
LLEELVEDYHTNIEDDRATAEMLRADVELYDRVIDLLLELLKRPYGFYDAPAVMFGLYLHTADLFECGGAYVAALLAEKAAELSGVPAVENQVPENGGPVVSAPPQTGVVG